MKNGLIWVWVMGLILAGVGCGDSASQPPLPTFNFNFDEEEEEDTESTTEGESAPTSEDSTDGEGGEEADSADGTGTAEEETDAVGAEDEDGTASEGDAEEEEDTDEGEESPEEADTEDETGEGSTETGGGTEIDLCDVIDPPSTTKYGVCKNILKCDCEDGEYTCNYGIVPNHELFETTCDGLDNDCDGATDEGLVDINASTCPNVGVCSNTVFAFCHMGSWYCDFGLAPSFEFAETLCDGLDNDCDGQVDESVSFDSVTCKSEGVCAGNAEPVCNDGSIVCDYSNAGILYQEEETRCDSLDNDCDGETDEMELTDLSASDCDPSQPQFSPCCAADGVCDGSVSATCSQGGWTCNYDGIEGYQPEGETLCDGKDNDCDGEADEEDHLDPSTSDCSTDGVCAAAIPSCDASVGAWDCNLTNLVGYEEDGEVTCDNQDNDCDGEVDEGITAPQGPETTLCPSDGVCSLGVTTRCAEGIWTCATDLVDGFEEVEASCDLQDNDCDGLTDEELTTPTDGAGGNCEKYGTGVCTQFVGLACEAGEFSCTYDNVPLYEEEEISCDGLDNDCDGETDEQLNNPLTSGCLNVGVCANGVVASCQNKQWFCFYSNVEGYEQTETLCDGLDNDCDGQVDEGLTDIQNSTCKTTGVCSANVSAGCLNGDWLCDYSNVSDYSGEEEYVCDGLDNDCDGTADEFVCETTNPCTEDIQCVGNKCRATPGGGDSFCTEGTQCVQPFLTQEGVELVPSGSTACLNDSTYQTCVAGTWTNTISCPVETPVCDSGTCLICQPSTLDCENAEARVSCGLLGEGFEPVGGCSGTDSCVGGGFCVSPFSEEAGGMLVSGSQSQPFLIGYDDGSFLGGWTDESGVDGDGSGVFDRKFLQNGNPQGLESVVPTVKTGEQGPAVGSAVGEEAFVVWLDYGAGQNASLLGRKVTNLGDPSSATVEISPADSQHHFNPQVTRLVDGKIVVVWESGPTVVSQNTDISARLFDEDGLPLTSAFSVNAIKTGQQTHPDVVPLLDGRFIVTWESHDTGNGQIVFQRFKSDGTKQGSQITVNQSAAGDQTSPCAEVFSDGRIGFVYETDQGQGNQNASVLLRVFNSGGLADGPEQVIGENLSGSFNNPAIASVSNKGFVISSVEGADIDGFGTVRIFRYTLGKDPLADPIVLGVDSIDLAVEESGFQGEVALVGTDDNRIIALYTDSTPDSQTPEGQTEVRLQIFEFDYGLVSLIEPE